MDDETVAGIDAKVVGAGVPAPCELVPGAVGGFPGQTALEELPAQQSSRPRLRRNRRDGAIGHRHEQAVLVDTQPGATGVSVDTAENPGPARLDVGRQSGAVEALLSIGGDEHRRFGDSSVEEGEEAHGKGRVRAPHVSPSPFQGEGRGGGRATVVRIAAGKHGACRARTLRQLYARLGGQTRPEQWRCRATRR